MSRAKADRDTLDLLLRQLAELFEHDSATLNVSRGIADGFGTVGAQVADLSLAGSNISVRLWEEGNGDFRIEMGDEWSEAGWWRQDAKRAPLIDVLVALLHGRLEVAKNRVVVHPAGQKAITLRDWM